MDPQWARTPGIGSYVYCADNPLKYTDPDGEYFETAWDALNLAADIAFLREDIRAGDWWSVAGDAAGLVVDAIMTAVPVAPAFIGMIREGGRAADVLKAGDKALEMSKAVDKSSDVSKIAENSGDAMKAASTAAKYETHHLLPQQFRTYFENAGITIDAPEYLMKIEKGDHRLLPNGLHTLIGGDYNTAWKQFVDANPNAGAQDILNHLDHMKTEFGL